MPSSTRSPSAEGAARTINFTGFGKFSTPHRAARQGVNPRNPGEKVRSRRRPCRSSLPEASSSSRTRQLRRRATPQLDDAVRPRAGAAARRPPSGGSAIREREWRQACVASDDALRRPPRRGGRAQSAASSSSGSTRASTCCRSSCAATPTSPAAAARASRASAAGSSTRSRPYAVAVKPQLAFFEALGADGMRAFEEVCEYARAAGLLVIADGKRGDIGSTARAYAAAYLARATPPLADALTVNPYLGRDSIEPFLAACRRARRRDLLPRQDVERRRPTSRTSRSPTGGRSGSTSPRWSPSGARTSSASTGSRASAPSSARPIPRGRRGAAAAAAGRSCCCPGSARRARRPPTSPARSRAARRARSSPPRARSSTPSATAARTGAPPPASRPRACGARSGRVSGW